MSAFPETHGSVVVALAGSDAALRERALAVVVRVYREAVIAVLRRRWSLEPADAEDLAHDFFAHALEREWLSRYDVAKGRFRTFLRQCLFAYASTAHESATRLKRGGGAMHVDIDGLLGDPQLALAPDTADDALFDREWARSVLQLALDALEAECRAAGREQTWAVFVAHDVDGAELEEPPSYAALATRFALPRTQVTNYLNFARRRLRQHVLATLRDLTANEAEFRAEARALLGAVP